MRRTLYNVPLFFSPDVALQLASEAPDAASRDAKGYAVRDGVAIIPVRGALANREEDAWWSGGSYQGLRETLGACLGDPTARGIVLDIDSPGGEAAGAMELATHIRAASARKRVVAHVDGMAASAAYALASGAETLICAPSALLGSIGVVMLHVDISQMLARVGVKPTLLHSGAHKTDGTALKPLDAGAAGRLQAMLDVHYRHFLETVGAHRPALGAAGARKTEAGLFVGAQAVAAGLADATGDLPAAMRAALAPATMAPARAALENKPAHGGKVSGANPMTKSDEQRGREAFAMARQGGAGGAVAAPRLSAEERQRLEAAVSGRAPPPTEAQLADFERGRRAFAALKGK